MGLQHGKGTLSKTKVPPKCPVRLFYFVLFFEPREYKRDFKGEKNSKESDGYRIDRVGHSKRALTNSTIAPPKTSDFL